MPGRDTAFDVERLIAEVAARHRILLRPDDAALAIVTMNRLVLEESLDVIHARVVEDLRLFQTAAEKLQKHAGAAISAEVRESAAVIRSEIQRDVEKARLEVSQVVRRVEAAYEESMSRNKLMIVSFAALFVLLIGIWIGRVSGLWWPV